VLGRERAREPTRVTVPFESDALRHAAKGDRRGRSPRRRGENRRVERAAPYGHHRSREFAKAAFAVPRRTIPKRIGRDDVVDVRYERRDVTRVGATPQGDRGGRKSFTQRRREGGRKHQVAQVIQTDQQNTPRRPVARRCRLHDGKNLKRGRTEGKA